MGVGNDGKDDKLPDGISFIRLYRVVGVNAKMSNKPIPMIGSFGSKVDNDPPKKLTIGVKIDKKMAKN